MEHHFVFVIHVSNSCIQALAFSHSPGAAAIGTVLSEKAKPQLQRFHHLRPCQCKDTKETHLQLMFKFTVEMTLNHLRSEGVPQVTPKAGLLRAGMQGAV